MRSFALPTLLVLSLSLPSPARAGSDYDRVCGADGGLKSAQSVQEQKKPYCEAAKTAKKGASSNDLLWKVWAGVAGVCTTACVMSLAGNPIDKLICATTNIGASVTDAVVTKEFASSLMSIGLSAGGLVNAPKQGSKKDFAACGAAAMATMQVITKKKAADASRETVRQNLASAQELDSSSRVARGALPPTSNGAGGDPSVGDTSPLDLTDAGCGTQDALTCAAARDAGLPPWVKDEAFARELAKNSAAGSASGFLSSARTPSAAISGLVGGALGDAQLSELRTAVARAERDLRYAPSQPVEYAAAASKSRSGASGSDEISFDPSSFLAGLLGGDAGTGQARSPSGVSTQAFDSKARPNLGLFDRVHDRYRLVTPRMEAL